MNEERIKCPSCDLTLVLSAMHKVPELPHALCFASGCPNCNAPFVVARMAEGLRAFVYTRTSDINGRKHVQVKDEAVRAASKKAMSS